MAEYRPYLEHSGMCTSNSTCNALIEQYDPSSARFNGSVAGAYIQANGDFEHVCPMLALVGYLSRTLPADRRVYSFIFGHLTALDLAAQAEIVNESAPGTNGEPGSRDFIYS